MRVARCGHCGKTTVLRLAVKGGKSVLATYNASADRLHKFECHASPWPKKPTEPQTEQPRK